LSLNFLAFLSTSRWEYLLRLPGFILGLHFDFPLFLLFFFGTGIVSVTAIVSVTGVKVSVAGVKVSVAGGEASVTGVEVSVTSIKLSFILSLKMSAGFAHWFAQYKSGRDLGLLLPFGFIVDGSLWMGGLVVGGLGEGLLMVLRLSGGFVVGRVLWMGGLVVGGLGLGGGLLVVLRMAASSFLVLVQTPGVLL